MSKRLIKRNRNDTNQCNAQKCLIYDQSSLFKILVVNSDSKDIKENSFFTFMQIAMLTSKCANWQNSMNGKKYASIDKLFLNAIQISLTMGFLRKISVGTM